MNLRHRLRDAGYLLIKRRSDSLKKKQVICLNKKDILKDMKQLINDFGNQDHTTVGRTEEKKTESGTSLKTEYVLRGKVGIIQKKPE